MLQGHTGARISAEFVPASQHDAPVDARATLFKRAVERVGKQRPSAHPCRNTLKGSEAGRSNMQRSDRYQGQQAPAAEGAGEGTDAWDGGLQEKPLSGDTRWEQ